MSLRRALSCVAAASLLFYGCFDFDVDRDYCRKNPQGIAESGRLCDGGEVFSDAGSDAGEVDGGGEIPDAGCTMGAVAACAITNSFGTCAGQWTCTDAGVYGTCLGRSAATERCNDRIDNDCNGRIDCPGDVFDGISLQSAIAGQVQLFAVTSSADGVYVAGFIDGLHDFGPGPIGDSGSLSILVARLNPATLRPVWTVAFGGPVNAYRRATSIALSSSGLFVSGVFEGATTFGNAGPLTNRSRDGFVVRMDPADGKALQVALIGDDTTSNGDQNVYIAGLSQSAVHVIGSFTVALSLNTPLTFASAGGVDGFVARLASDNLSPLSAEVFGGVGSDSLNQGALSPSGLGIGVGSFSAAMTKPPIALPAPDGGRDGIIAVLDGGQLFRGSAFGGGGAVSLNVVALTATDEVVVGGFASGTGSFGPGCDFDTGGTGLQFVAKATTAGGCAWLRLFRGARDLNGLAISNGVVTIHGTFDLLVQGDWDAGPTISDGGQQAFTAVVDVATGTPVSLTTMGGPQSDFIWGSAPGWVVGSCGDGAFRTPGPVVVTCDGGTSGLLLKVRQ